MAVKISGDPKCDSRPAQRSLTIHDNVSDRTPKGRSRERVRLTPLADTRLRPELARYSSDAELIVLPAAISTFAQPTDFNHAGRRIGEARRAARDLLSRSEVVALGVGRLLTVVATS